ncbi:MAG TPA: hypothetical protein VF851_00055 [Steroidobacteraceae bacterium]
MRKQTFAALGAALVGLAGAPSLLAQDLDVPPAPAASAQVETPTRGMSKAQVEKKFGEPTQRVAAVGQPPISSWVYPAFTVYFEYDHVIHAVLTPAK